MDLDLECPNCESHDLCLYDLHPDNVHLYDRQKVVFSCNKCGYEFIMLDEPEDQE